MVLMKYGLNITTRCDFIAVLVNPSYQKDEEKNSGQQKCYVTCYFTIFVHIFHLSYASGSMNLYVKTSILSKCNNIFQQKILLKIFLQ